MIATFVLIAVIAAVLAPLIRRDLARACVRRADRLPRVSVTLELDVSRFVAAMDSTSRAIGRMRPAMRSFEAELRRVRDALDAGAVSIDEVRALGDRLDPRNRDR